MLVREGADRNDTIDLWLACCLAGIAGGLNSAAFYTVGFFSANMTGNVSALSGSLALEQWTKGLFYVSIVLVFIGGAMCAALTIDAGRRQRMAGIYAYAIVAESTLLLALGCADLWVVWRWRVPVVVLGLAFLMGFQNAVGTRISGAKVRTTHISGLATDIGIELAAAIDKVRFRGVGIAGAGNPMKLRLHVCTVLSFLAGGVGGVLLFRSIGAYMLIVSAALLFAIAFLAIAQSRRIASRVSAGAVP